MRLKVIALFVIVMSSHVFAQTSYLEKLGLRQIHYSYQGDSVAVIIKSKKGDELKKKPLFFFCQGSMPVPLIIIENGSPYPLLPFSLDSICERFHFVMVGKPYVPLSADVKALRADFTYFDVKTQLPPKEYTKRNLPDYYVNRNTAIISFLSKQTYVDKSEIVVAGHSQGARIALEVGYRSKNVTKIIFASGNPLGQVMSMLGQVRMAESATDTINGGDDLFSYWSSVVLDSTNLNGEGGDTYKATFDFSKSSMHTFKQLKKPILVCYGTKDPACLFNDYLRIEMIRQGKRNVKFKDYLGLEHNYFGLSESGKIDYNNFNWDKVVADWLLWLEGK